MENKIVDLILPEVLTTSQLGFAVYSEVAKYLLQNNRNWSETSIIDNIDEMKIIKDKIIANNKPIYDKQYWEKTEELNSDNFKKCDIDMFIYNYYLYLSSSLGTGKDTSICFHFHEVDLINKQYRLLQEIYYSRLGNES